MTEPFSEKYVKKVIKKLIQVGNNDIEDALKRLDRLTQEEARMVSAQQLKITNAIDSGVREVAGNVLVIGDKVKAVDEKLLDVIDGAQYIFFQSSKFVQLPTRLGRKEAREVIQQTADDVDQVKRSWSQPHSCRTCRLNHPHRESITT
jgi:hypothetical protein